MYKKISSYFLLLALFSFFFSACNKKEDKKLVSNTPECDASKSLIWCQEKNKCLNVEEEDCPQLSSDPAKTILDSAIKLYNPSDITISTDRKLSWVTEKGTKAKEYSSRSFKVAKASLDQKNLLSKLLLDSGFDIDSQNLLPSTLSSSTGYKNASIICQLVETYQGDEEQVKKGLGQLQLELLCSSL